jgi:hypothetical protein
MIDGTKKKVRKEWREIYEECLWKGKKYRGKFVLRRLTLVEMSMNAEASLKFYFTFFNNFIYLFCFRHLSLIIFCVFNIYL